MLPLLTAQLATAWPEADSHKMWIPADNGTIDVSSVDLSGVGAFQDQEVQLFASWPLTEPEVDEAARALILEHGFRPRLALDGTLVGDGSFGEHALAAALYRDRKPSGEVIRRRGGWIQIHRGPGASADALLALTTPEPCAGTDAALPTERAALPEEVWVFQADLRALVTALDDGACLAVDRDVNLDEPLKIWVQGTLTPSLALRAVEILAPQLGVDVLRSSRRLVLRPTRPSGGSAELLIVPAGADALAEGPFAPFVVTDLDEATGATFTTRPPPSSDSVRRDRLRERIRERGALARAKRREDLGIQVDGDTYTFSRSLLLPLLEDPATYGVFMYLDGSLQAQVASASNWNLLGLPLLSRSTPAPLSRQDAVALLRSLRDQPRVELWDAEEGRSITWILEGPSLALADGWRPPVLGVLHLVRESAAERVYRIPRKALRGLAPTGRPSYLTREHEGQLVVIGGHADGEQLGWHSGDVLTHLDGQPAPQLRDVLKTLLTAATSEIAILREGEAMTLTYHLDGPPIEVAVEITQISASPEHYEVRTGLETRKTFGPTSCRMLPHLGHDGETDGYRLSGIRRNTVAEELGLRNGDIITHVDGRPMVRATDALAFFDAMGSRATLALSLIRRGEPVELRFLPPHEAL